MLQDISHAQKPVGPVELLAGAMMVLAKSVRSFEEEHLGVIILGHILALQGDIVVIPFGIWGPELVGRLRDLSAWSLGKVVTCKNIAGQFSPFRFICNVSNHCLKGLVGNQNCSLKADILDGERIGN